jgi:WhiB family redox-sensing transcriptional regulator
VSRRITADRAGDLVVSGDLNRGHLVHSTPYRFERSDDYAFANDQASFRGVWRLNGRIRDTNAIGAVPKHSLCLEYPDVNFFPTCETANGRCDRCLVRVECGEHAMCQGIADGVWGGLTAPQRRPLRRPKAA